MSSTFRIAHEPTTAINSSTIPAHIAVLIAMFAAGTVAQGGYYLAGRVLVTALVAVALVLALRTAGWSRADTFPVAVTCAALELWALFRGGLGGRVPDATGAAATLGGLVAVLAVLRRTGPAERERCAEAVLGVGVLVAVTAWAGVAWRIPRLAVLVDDTLWRGASTLTYPNAAAALLVPLSLLALARWVARDRSVLRAGLAYLLLVGVGAALSRGGLIGLAVGFAVLAVCAGVLRTLWRAAAVLLGAAVAVGALVPSFPATATPRPLLALLGLAAGAVVALGPVRLSARWRAAALLVVGALSATAAVTRLGGTDLGTVLGSRGNLDSAGRTGALRASLHLFRAHPGHRYGRRPGPVLLGHPGRQRRGRAVRPQRVRAGAHRSRRHRARPAPRGSRRPAGDRTPGPRLPAPSGHPGRCHCRPRGARRAQRLRLPVAHSGSPAGRRPVRRARRSGHQ